MPIKGLSEDVRMPRLGKIHLGIRVPVLDKDGKPKIWEGKPVMRPEKTDYFVLDKENSAYKKMVELYGEKPKALPVLIPIEDAEQWASQYYMAYDMTHGLVCRGDGQEVSFRTIDIETNELPTKATKTVTTIDGIECPGRDCPTYKAKKCNECMKLRLMLPEVPGLGIWQIDTGSINSILNINSCAKIIKRAFGRLTMVPLLLTLEPIEVPNPETGKKQKVFVLNLRSTVTLAQLADVAREQAKTFYLPDWDVVMEQKAEADIKLLYGDETTRSDETRTVDKATGEIKEKVQTDSDRAFDELQSANVKPPAAEKKTVPEKKETVKMTPAPAATIPPKIISGVDMDWLKESLTKLKWKNVIVDYLAKPPFSCLSPRISGCLLELGDKPELIAKFLKEIQDRLDMQNPPPPTDDIPF